jgi:phosphate transport system substrate-binding protein
VKRWYVVLAGVVVGVGCTSNRSKSTGDTTTPAAASATRSGADLNGAGATFPFPLYSKWFSNYAAKTGVKINYQPIGSGGGIKQLQEQTVDFGASDAPMTDTEMSQAKGGPVMHIPTVVGVVAVAYNLPGVTQAIKLTGATVADIFSGKITKWNDSRIAALNPGLALPNTDVLVVHRTEASGTTFVFSDYLSSVSAAWKSAPGKGKELQWPVGLGAKGNDGVTAQVKQTPGAIGYVELAYVKQNGLTAALIQNSAHKFVAPAASSATAAADAAAAKLQPNSDYRISIVNSPGADTYPITSFTWILVYRNQPDAAKAKKLTDFLRWALTDGQAVATPLDYAPLPPSLASRLVSRLDSVTTGASQPVASGAAR